MPYVRLRSSCAECSVSENVTATGSPNTVTASSKETPCLRSVFAAVAGSAPGWAAHSLRTSRHEASAGSSTRSGTCKAFIASTGFGLAPNAPVALPDDDRYSAVTSSGCVLRITRKPPATFSGRGSVMERNSPAGGRSPQSTWSAWSGWRLWLIKSETRPGSCPSGGRVIATFLQIVASLVGCALWILTVVR